MKRSKLIELARTDGMIVTETPYGDVTIFKSKRGLGVTLWPNGTATRADCHPSVCNRMTINQAARLLGFSNRR